MLTLKISLKRSVESVYKLRVTLNRKFNYQLRCFQCVSVILRYLQNSTQHKESKKNAKTQITSASFNVFTEPISNIALLRFFITHPSSRLLGFFRNLLPNTEMAKYIAQYLLRWYLAREFAKQMDDATQMKRQKVR